MLSTLMKMILPYISKIMLKSTIKHIAKRFIDKFI